jgi:hypothetical protein
VLSWLPIAEQVDLGAAEHVSVDLNVKALQGKGPLNRGNAVNL